jgi:hypothetical protein
LVLLKGECDLYGHRTMSPSDKLGIKLSIVKHQPNEPTCYDFANATYGSGEGKQVGLILCGTRIAHTKWGPLGK